VIHHILISGGPSSGRTSRTLHLTRDFIERHSDALVAVSAPGARRYPDIAEQPIEGGSALGKVLRWASEHVAHRMGYPAARPPALAVLDLDDWNDSLLQQLDDVAVCGRSVDVYLVLTMPFTARFAQHRLACCFDHERLEYVRHTR
jgi:hypothetical protein